MSVKTYDQAYKEALEALSQPDVYELYDWTWGYKEESGNVEQNEMFIHYRFWFKPNDPEDGDKSLARMIEVNAQK